MAVPFETEKSKRGVVGIVCFSDERRREGILESILKYLPSLGKVVPHIFTRFLFQTNCVRNLFTFNLAFFKIFFSKLSDLQQAIYAKGGSCYTTPVWTFLLTKYTPIGDLFS